MKTKQFKLQNLSFLLLAFGFMLTTGMKCKKDSKLSGKNELPPITQEGKNTFGCMFENEFWLPTNFIELGYPNLNISYYPVEKTVRLICRRQNPIDENRRDYMLIAYDDIILKEGEYLLRKENSRVNVSIRDKEYFLHDDGKLTITRLDTDKKIISGTFYFNVKEESTGEIVEITSGRFDAIYSY